MRISLCIVARNEAAFIRACITSAQPVVDEVIVVDTGSSDRTPEIARGSGAHVIEAEWPGNLGAAHDLPLRYATGEWILSLDADEVLDPGSRDRLRETVLNNRSRADGLRVPIRNYDYGFVEKFRRADPEDPLARGALTYRETSPVRLFRHDFALRFQGYLHQSAARDIRQRGGRVAVAPLLIHHYGWLRADRPRTSFYRALARRQVAARPMDPAAWIELGIILGDTDLPAALDAFRRARRLGQRGATSYLVGVTLLGLEQARAAIPYLTSAVRHNPGDRSQHYDRSDALELLGAAYEAVGDRRRAEASLRRAIALRPDSPAAQNDLAGLLSERGAHRQATVLLTSLLDRFGGLGIAANTLGLVHLRRGDLDLAQRAFERAVSVDARNVNAGINLEIVRTRKRRARATRVRTRMPERHHGGPPGPALPRSLFRWMSPGGLVSVIANLHGGAGRVLVDAVRALTNRQHLVLCRSDGAWAGLAFAEELKSLHARVQVVESVESVRGIISAVRPACVLEHWWANDFIAGPGRSDDAAPWICVGHQVQAMPGGYDAYVILSAFQERQQSHLRGQRIYRFANGVESARYRGTGRRSSRQVAIAMVSRLDPSKFPRRLVDYLPPLVDLGARVLVAGTGGRRFEIEPELVARRLDRHVRFVGAIRSTAMPRFLARVDIGLHLTETQEEVCSLAILEMLAAGLPIVAEPKGCLPEMVVHGENGFLSETPAEVAWHLQQLIEDPALRRRMGAASRRMSRKYSLTKFENSIRTMVADVCRVRTARASRFPKRSTPALTIWRPERSVLVCGTPRAGSALMCEALWNTGLAGRSPTPADDGFVAPGRSLRGFDAAGIGLVIEDRSAANGVFAAACSLPQFEDLLDALDSGADRTDRKAGALRDVLPNLQVLWIERRDKLRQAISWVRATQSGVFSRTVDDAEAVPGATPIFDAAAIRQSLQAIGEQETRWRELLSSCAPPPIEVSYEDLVDDYEGIARRVLAGLRIRIPRDLVFGARRLVRQADAVTERWVRRFKRDHER